MEEMEAKTWAEFTAAIEKLEVTYGTIVLSSGEKMKNPNQILFRGQTDATWLLETTLERSKKERMNVRDYVLAARRCANELESFSGKRWNLKPWPELHKDIEAIDAEDSFMFNLPCYEYLLYLRHHGFPSPLLDWSTSPYIAAYFAYCDAVDAEKVAVCAYISTTTGYWTHTGGPRIHTHGPFATTSPRHFAQKAQYTTATEWVQAEKKHYFCPHTAILSRPGKEQDLLVKVTLPMGKRTSFLRRLDSYNINHFTLFQSEDALVRTMGMKVFDLEDE